MAIDWPGVDFDVDKTLTINVDVAAYEDEEAFAGPLTTSLTVTAQIEPVTAELYHADLSEESLDTAAIILYLHSDRWADATLDHTLFTATNLPTGASLAGVTYVNDTTATLDVTYDGTDFDADITDFNVTIPASEIDFFGSDVISADYTIRAIDEGPETLAAAWATVPGTNGVEPTIDGDAVTLTLTNGTFVAPQVNLITIPASVTTNTGVSIESIAFVDTHTVRIELQHDGVTDYDVDEVMTFTLPAAAYEEGSIDLTASITLVATLEPIYLYLTSAPALDEVTNLDGATIDLELSSGTWIDATLEIDSLILGPATPLGVTATAFTYVDPTHATVTLAYDGTDFDHDVTDFYLTVDKNQVVSAPIDVVSDSLTITALEELGGESLSVVWSAGSTGAEADDPNDDELTATLAGGTLIASALTTANVTLSGDAATAAGVTIESVTYVDPTTFTVAIDWDGTDFDVDKTITVTLSASAYRDSDPDGDLSASETMTATDEGPEALSVAYVDPANGQEDLIDQAVIEATLTNGTFIQSQITLANITPSGTAFDDANITFEAPIYVDLHTIRVPVHYDGAIDFDFDKILTLNVAAAAYAEGSADLSGDLTVTAIQEPVSLFAAATPSLTEENLHTATVTLELDDDVWADGVIDAATNAKLLNAPAGLTIAAITWIDDTHAEMTFNFTGRDFDTTVTDMRVQIEAPELFAWPDSVISTPLTITPSTTETDEFITLAWANPPGTDGAEATLDADAIIVDIGGGTFNASETDLAYFVASGTAVTDAGVTLESVTFVDTHKVRIEVSWDGTDFDVAKTLTIRVAPPAYGDGTDTLAANITITPTVEPVLVVISHPTGLSETQLDTVFVELISETWADATLDPSNFLLNNRPLGVGVERVDYVDPTHAKIVLDYDGTDFDSDITNFNVTVRDDEFSLAGPDVTSNNLTITAIPDNPETISLAWTQAGMGVEENLLRNDTLRVTLANGTFFASQATLSNVNESGDAVTDAHVYLDGVIFVDDKTLLIPLTLIDSVDFDADKTLTITIDADAYNEGTTDLTASIPIIHSAETATVSITPIGVAQLTEGNVANRPVAIKLNSDTWAGGAVTLANFTLNGAPPGVTLASVFYVDADSAYGVLAFDGTDFDSDYSIDVTVAAAQTTSSATDVTSNSLTILANADAESISISFRDPPGTNGQKSTIDAEVLVVTISGGTFDAANIDLINVLGSGEATTAAGVSLEAATYVDKHTIHIPLAWDGTDYTTDVTLDIEILAPGYDDNASGSSLTASVVLPVNPAITISHPTGLTESNIVATSITLSVANDQFADATLNKANFTAINAPTGLAIDSVVYVDARTATVYLSYPGYDFDVDYPDFAIVAAAAEFTTTSSSLESNALPIVADPGAETLALEWSSPPGTNGLEATMDDEVILAILTEGTFVKTQMKNLNFVASGDATSSGVGVESVAYVSADTVAISITWDGTDYDVDKTLTITLQPAAYQDGDSPIPASITLPATIENATAILSANPTLHEENNL
ncbi:MAG: hypothetical protein GF419_00100, partial [Ignavibacteriales bacterium]|nr:hypothetical protein [Ignavibacteriales bacterium]